MFDPKKVEIKIGGNQGMCPWCEREFVEIDGDFYVRIYKNQFDQWVGIAYHKGCGIAHASMESRLMGIFDNDK